ncbi:MAG: OSTA/TMEM184 family protein, partial [Clostridiales bacterium]|nr:OSTA/TMEM184 family protein [Clostridiales bacterium]
NDVAQPLTTIPTQTSRAAGIEVSVRKDGGSEFPISGATRAFVDVFAQSSLIFKDDTNVTGAPSSLLSGSKSNVFESEKTKIELMLATEGQDEKTFAFRDLFADLGNINVAYEGERGDAAFTKLKSTFGSGEDAYILSNATYGSITIKAQKVTLEDTEYSFTIQLRRFYGSSFRALTFGEGENAEAAEVAYVRFTVTVVAPSRNFMTLITTASKDGGAIVERTTKRLSERVNFGANSDYVLGTLYEKGEFQINVTSSDPTIVTAAFSKEEKGIVLTPYTSGTAYIYYTIKCYSYTLQDSFKITVNTLATYNKTVNVITDEKIYFSDLKNYLQAANAIDASSLTPRFASTPYYFQETDTTGVPSSTSDAERTWTTLDSYPAFLEEPYIDQTEDKAYFGLRMGQYDPDQLNLDNTITRCVVVFVSNDGKEYRVAFRVAPGAQTAKDNSRTLLIGIDKANKTINILSSETQDASLICTGDNYIIPMAFLAKKIHNFDKDLQYEIIAAQAISSDGYTNFTKYLDVAMNANEVILTPKYPTADLKNMDGCNLQVSLKHKNTQVVTLLNFTVSVTGIKTVLTKSEYTTLILATFFAVLALLLIIFFIRLAIYWKKKAEQRKIIRKNQMLIRMRDKMHNKTEAVSKEKLVRTKLKMEDPKYAKMFTEMRQNKESQTGITLENSAVAQKAENRVKAEKASKKHKGKKSIDELKAELEAKRAAFAAMQSGEMPEGGIPVDAMDGMQMDQSMMGDAPVFTDVAYNDGLSGEDIDAQIKTHISSEDIVFDPDPMNPDDIDNNL